MCVVTYVLFSQIDAVLDQLRYLHSETQDAAIFVLLQV